MSLPVLYSFRRCPYAMRARMAVRTAGVPVALREVVLRDKPPSLLEVSPKGTVPVLVLGDRVLEESLDIMRWALACADPEGWLPADEQARADTEALLAANDGPFKHHLDRFKYSTRYAGADPLAHRDAAGQFLDSLEARLVEQPFLLGARRTLADIAIFPFVRQFANADGAWWRTRPYAGVDRWLSGLVADAVFTGVMQKFPQWQDGDAVTRFPDQGSSTA